jgi:hypothetical protein
MKAVNGKWHNGKGLGKFWTAENRLLIKQTETTFWNARRNNSLLIFRK